MMEMSQPIAVRISSTSFIAAVAFYDSLQSPEVFQSKGFLKRVKISLQDVNWEVRREMALGLPAVFKQIGPREAEQQLLLELGEVLADEEQDV